MSPDFLYGVMFGTVLGFALALWILPLAVDIYTSFLRQYRRRTRDVR